MSNEVYPTLPGLEWPVRRASVFNTKVSTTPSGREWTQARMVYPRFRYQLRYEFLRSQDAWAEFQTLFGFFERHAGAGDSFLFRDRDDRTVASQLIGTGTGSQVAFQLLRTRGGYTQPVWEVDSTVAAPVVTVGGVVQTAGVAYTIGANGLLTFTSAPAAAAEVRWSGDYYWRARFDMDEMDGEEFMRFFWKAGQVRLITRLP